MTKIIYTRKGQEILVDDEDYEELNSSIWFVTRKGYAARNVAHPLEKGKWTSELMHRRILGLGFGDKRVGDHINHAKLDNQRGNLRICTNSENLFNRGANRNNTSGFKGVNYSRETRKKWAAEIWKDGKKKHLGFFETPEEAHEAYCKAAADMHGEFANFGLPKKAA